MSPALKMLPVRNAESRIRGHQLAGAVGVFSGGRLVAGKGLRIVSAYLVWGLCKPYLISRLLLSRLCLSRTRNGYTKISSALPGSLPGTLIVPATKPRAGHTKLFCAANLRRPVLRVGCL